MAVSCFNLRAFGCWKCSRTSKTHQETGRPVLSSCFRILQEECEQWYFDVLDMLPERTTQSVFGEIPAALWPMRVWRIAYFSECSVIACEACGDTCTTRRISTPAFQETLMWSTCGFFGRAVGHCVPRINLTCLRGTRRGRKR